MMSAIAEKLILDVTIGDWSDLKVRTANLTLGYHGAVRLLKLRQVYNVFMTSCICASCRALIDVIICRQKDV